MNKDVTYIRKHPGIMAKTEVIKYTESDKVVKSNKGKIMYPRYSKTTPGNLNL